MRALVALVGLVGLVLCVRLDLSTKRQAALGLFSALALVAAARRRRDAGRPVEDYHYLA